MQGYRGFIDNSNERIYDLKHKIRFTNVSEYPVKNIDSLTGFVADPLPGLRCRIHIY